MVIVKSVQGLCSDDYWGKMGVSCGFGLITFGASYFGEINDMTGIYSHKHTKKGRKISKMRSYAPTNPRTTLQQSHRTIYANGVIAWRNLDIEEKRAYNRIKYLTGLSGYNYFMKKYLLENS